MLSKTKMLASLALLGVCSIGSANAGAKPSQDQKTEHMSELLELMQSQMDAMRLEYATEIEKLQQQQESMNVQYMLKVEQMKEMHQQELDNLSAALEKQQGAVDSVVEDLDKTQRIQEMTARHLASVGLDDLDSFSGIEIKKDSAMISLGDDADVKILRTDFGTLEVLADEYHIHGTLHVDNIMVNGTDLSDACNCGGSSSAGQTEFRLQALTGSADYSDTTDEVYVEFLVNHQWTDKFIFFSMSDIEDIEDETFYLDGVPSSIRFSLSGDNAWGIGQVAAWVDGGEEMILLCSTVIGDTPSIGGNGHWIDGDSDSVPTTLTLDVEDQCASIVTVTAVTGWDPSAGTDDTVYIEFYVDDEWIDAEPFFTSADPGDEVEQTYGLAADPTQMRITISDGNAWGFDFMSITLHDNDDEILVLSCEYSMTGMSADSQNWIDTDGSGDVPDELVLSIEDSNCDSSEVHSIKVEVLTGAAEHSDSTDDIYVQFFMPDSDQWSGRFLLFSGTSIGDIEEGTYNVYGMPTDLKFSLSGNNAWGIGQVGVWIDDDEEMIILCSTVIGDDPSYGDNGHWIDGDSDTVPTTLTLALEDTCSHIVEVEVHTGTVQYSDTSNDIYVSFYVDDSWTTTELFHDGSDTGDVEIKTFGLEGNPTQIEFSILDNDGWGFDFVQLTINDDDVYVLSCADSQQSYGASDHWIDGDGSSSGVYTEIVLDIEHTDCS